MKVIIVLIVLFINSFVLIADAQVYYTHEWERSNKLLVNIDGKLKKKHYDNLVNYVIDVASEEGFNYFTFYRQNKNKYYHGHAFKKVIRNKTYVWCYRNLEDIPDAVVYFYEIDFTYEDELLWNIQ